MPKALALQTGLITITVNLAEKMAIEHQASSVGLSVQDYLRDKLGLRRRPMGRPVSTEISAMEADARERLVSIGVDPAPYLPARIQSEDEESPEDRATRIARLREATARMRAGA
jgi:hypothetical protein